MKAQGFDPLTFLHARRNPLGEPAVVLGGALCPFVEVRPGGVLPLLVDMNRVVWQIWKIWAWVRQPASKAAWGESLWGFDSLIFRVASVR